MEKTKTLQDLANEKALNGYRFLYQIKSDAFQYVDLEELEMASYQCCIIGQIEPQQSYHSTVETLLELDGEDPWYADTDLWEFEHGFNSNGNMIARELGMEGFEAISQAFHDYFKCLDVAWRELLTEGE